jgi:hypothetical protein
MLRVNQCPICTTPRGWMTPAQLAAPCQCGAALKCHDHVTPHACIETGCRDYTLPRVARTVASPGPEQLPLLEEKRIDAAK